MAKRLEEERADLEANPDERFFVESKTSDLSWTMRMMIDDAADCCYAGGCYELEVTFPAEYPFKMPIITWNPPPFHTCISQEDGTCNGGQWDQKWGPTKNVRWIMCELYKMFLDEGSDGYLEAGIERLKQDNYEAFVKKVKDQITELNE